MMEKIQMRGVPETMLQTLYARAAYSKKSNAKFRDDKAVEIVSHMDYDFSLAGKDAMMSKGVIARTILLDRMLMYGKEASNRKQEIDRQHHTIPNQRNQRPKTSIVEMCITGYGIMDNSIHSTWKS